MNIEQQIAKDLRDSGLFDGIAYHLCKPPYLQRAKVKPFHVGAIKKWAQQNKSFIDYGPWPDSDTMWSILAKMGLQVFWIKNSWYLVDTQNFFYTSCWNWICKIPNVAQSQLTLANNAAGAWISKQPEWRPKLEAAINKVRGKK